MNDSIVTKSIKPVRMRTFGVGQQSTTWISVGAGFFLLLAWYVATQISAVPKLFLPSPFEVLHIAQSIYLDGYANASFWEHVSASLYRILTAAVIAVALGVPLGLWMGLNRWAKGIISAPVAIYWPIPPLAYLPLLIIWLGIGEVSKITLLTLAMFAPILISSQSGVRNLSIERVHVALSLGATRKQLFLSVVLPAALPDILTGIQISLGVGWSTLVAAELIAANKGIGYMIMSASHFLSTEVVFVGIAMIAINAFIFSFVLRAVEAWLVPWKGKL